MLVLLALLVLLMLLELLPPLLVMLAARVRPWQLARAPLWPRQGRRAQWLQQSEGLCPQTLETIQRLRAREAVSSCRREATRVRQLLLED